ncbi:HpcH/HpaI aldolase/citrate lyase family protein, partial [Brevibacterium luteolum]|uniref:HpcH/HpaI aldolase/citrate lyase family protein n=1 Tax=Brevibacterium luteolum TaxID=199591 RepID=UPI0021AF6A5B
LHQPHATNQLDQVSSYVPSAEIHALVEDATGVAEMRSVCRHPAVSSVGLGDNDLRASLHLRGDSALNFIRTQLVIELAAAGKKPPTASVFPNIKDTEGLYRDSIRLRDLGFIGRAAIHPAQLDPIRRAFKPSPSEVTNARKVIRAAELASADGRGAVALEDGSFVDQPFVEEARWILSLVD